MMRTNSIAEKSVFSRRLKMSALSNVSALTTNTLELIISVRKTGIIKH